MKRWGQGRRLVGKRWRGVRGMRRRGAALVEFAVVAPLLITFLFGIMEFGQLFKVRLTAQQAAREGCRLAVLQSTQKPYTGSGPVVQRIQDVLAAGGVTYSASMLSITEDTAGDPTVSVNLTIPYSDVALTGFLNTFVTQISGTCSMRKEGV